jgi:alpha-amylase
MNKKIALLAIVILVVQIGGCDNKLETTLSSPPPTMTNSDVKVTDVPTSTQPEPTPTDTSEPTPTVPIITRPEDYGWWNDVVFYELHVRSFYDSNGDGIGDFKGVIEKMDYLNDGDPLTTTDLGVGAIWMMPIHPTTTTHGYDVIDYYDVNPQYGTMADFQLLVDEAHTRGMRVIIDLVLNHSSSQNPWFIQSQDKNSPYRDYYVWSDTNPGFTGQWGQQVWYPASSGFYYAFFWEGMPDLNYTNPEVTEEIQNVTRFWLEDVGIDGFRLDAIGSLIEKGSTTVETPETHAWLKDYYQFYKSVNPEAFSVGEVWRENAVVIPYVQNKEVDLAFDFDLAAALLSSVNTEDPLGFTQVYRYQTTQFPEGQFGTFLANHDMARVMTQLGNSTDKARVAATLYLTLPGVPFIYYGEEIGMVGEAPDEMGRRPMQWSGDANAGFSTGEPWKAVDNAYRTANVQVEEKLTGSLLNYYRALVNLRNQYPALRYGTLEFIMNRDAGLYSMARQYLGEIFVVLVNMSGREISNYTLYLESSSLTEGKYTCQPLMGGRESAELTISVLTGDMYGFKPVEEFKPYQSVLLNCSNN